MSKQINLTNDEYNKLVELVFYGEWILNASKSSNDERDTKAEKLLEVILSYHKKFNLENWVNEYENEEYEIKEGIILKLLNNVREYEEDIFWGKLIDKFVDQEMIKKYGLRKLRKMDYEERIRKEDEFLQRYSKAIEKIGINALKLK